MPLSELNVKVDIKIGNVAMLKDQNKPITRAIARNRHPIWNQIFEVDIMLDKNI
jgi:hypothetical protein